MALACRWRSRPQHQDSLSIPAKTNADIELVSCRELLATSKMLLERGGQQDQSEAARSNVLSVSADVTLPLPTGCSRHPAPLLMPRAFRLMRFELKWFEGKPLPPSSHVPRRSADSESAPKGTRCGLGSHSPCKLEGQSAAGSAGTNK
jgi:hypothetical protein